MPDNSSSLASKHASSVISRLFFWQKRGNLEVTIVQLIDNQSVPVENAIVNIGGLCTTDSQGKCTIKNISAGEQKIRIYDKKTLEPYQAVKANGEEIKTVKIEKDKTNKSTLTVR